VASVHARRRGQSRIVPPTDQTVQVSLAADELVSPHAQVSSALGHGETFCGMALCGGVLNNAFEAHGAPVSRSGALAGNLRRFGGGDFFRAGHLARDKRSPEKTRPAGPPARESNPFKPDAQRIMELYITPRELEILGLTAAGAQQPGKLATAQRRNTRR